VELKGRTVFITGAASGIGFGMAQAFLDAGSNVVLTDLDEARLQLAQEELGGGERVVTAVLDVGSLDAWQHAVEMATQAFGSVDVLCANAGLHSVGWDLDEVTPEVWDLVIRTNLTGTYLGIRSVLPLMKASGRPAHVVITSSLAGVRAMPKNGPYVATKHALVGLADALRAELAETPIGVSLLIPGYVPSSINQNSERLRVEVGSEAGPDLDALTKRAAPREESARDVGQMVVDAVSTSAFYIVTHPEHAPAIAARNAELLAAFGQPDPLSS